MKRYNLSGFTFDVAEERGGEIYEVFLWDGLRRRDVYAKFLKVWFRFSKFVRGDTYRGTTHTHRQQGHLISLLLLFQNKRGRAKTTVFEAFRWYNI
jgi:hypothetical protein